MSIQTDDTNPQKDPFYFESNVAHLLRGIDALENGEGVEHALIEPDDEK